MAKMTVGKGVGVTIDKFENVSKQLSNYMKPAIYKASGFMIKKINAALKSLEVVDGKKGLPPYAAPGSKLQSISSVQKQDLINGLGIAGFSNDNGFLNVKIGFDGYGSYPTQSHPNGIPNVLLIRSLENGTSFLKRNPVITNTVNANRKQTEKILEDEFNKIITKEL